MHNSLVSELIERERENREQFIYIYEIEAKFGLVSLLFFLWTVHTMNSKILIENLHNSKCLRQAISRWLSYTTSRRVNTIIITKYEANLRTKHLKNDSLLKLDEPYLSVIQTRWYLKGDLFFSKPIYWNLEIYNKCLYLNNITGGPGYTGFAHGRNKPKQSKFAYFW